jgi:hypothetical protein
MIFRASSVIIMAPSGRYNAIEEPQRFRAEAPETFRKCRHIARRAVVAQPRETVTVSVVSSYEKPPQQCRGYRGRTACNNRQQIDTPSKFGQELGFRTATSCCIRLTLNTNSKFITPRGG